MTSAAERIAAAHIALRESRKWRHLAKSEDAFRLAVAGYFARQARVFLSGFRRAGPDVTESLGAVIESLVTKASEKAAPRLVRQWEAIGSEAARMGAADTAEDLGKRSLVKSSRVYSAAPRTKLPKGLNFDIKQHPAVIKHIKDFGAERVAGIDETTMKELQTILSRAITDGDSYSALAREIKNRWAEYATKSSLEHIRTRAELIAVTELGDAYEQGRLALGSELQGLGMTMRKSWLTVGDDRVCEICEANGAQDWIPFDDAHDSGDDAPTAHAGCRCDELVETDTPLD